MMLCGLLSNLLCGWFTNYTFCAQIPRGVGSFEKLGEPGFEGHFSKNLGVKKFSGHTKKFSGYMRFFPEINKFFRK
jgi:hypothetical protein